MGGAAQEFVAQDLQGDDVTPQAVCAPQPGLPPAAPQLEPGVWKNISPPGVPFGHNPLTVALAMAVDPCNPATIYTGINGYEYWRTGGGLYKSTDAGSTWTKISHLEEPNRMRINPQDGQHIVVADGVRGGTMGLWVSKDGGITFNQTPGWAAQRSDKYIDDLYDVAADPADFNHLLVAFHSPWGWNDGRWNNNSGVMETRDGGLTWITHPPVPGWGTGHCVWFVNSTTWLLGTQGNGFWRTTNSGASWHQVTTTNMLHGGGMLYKSPTGALYLTAYRTVLRNADGTGATWTAIGGSSDPNGGTGIIGDGNFLYTGPYFPPAPVPYVFAPESNPTAWKPFNQTVSSGPYEMVFDRVNRIVYSASWEEGVLALKVLGNEAPPGPPSGLRIVSP